MSYQAKIILDSISEKGDRLTTMEVTFPRMVLAEFNTHRMFSRNSASSRAIPVEKQLKKVIEDPFIPIYWGANQSGMQASKELEGLSKDSARIEWLKACDSAVSHAERLIDIGLHKQITNRLLEPFMWHTVIVTATDWSNFFALRAHEDAQPEIRKIAYMMRDLYHSSSPQEIAAGEWHLPFIQEDERRFNFIKSDEEVKQVSAARCARVSYLTHDGNRDVEADLTLFRRLVDGGHMSPLEHVATPFWRGEYSGNFKGWKQYRKFLSNEHDFGLVRKGLEV